MYPTIVDSQTGERKTLKDFDAPTAWWAEGDGSCDCNRAIYMGLDDQLGPGVCLGHHRFIAVDVHGDLEGWSRVEVLRAMNADYPADVVQMHINV